MSTEQNKEIARRYHDLNPDEVEEILTPDFIGRHRPGSGFTWTRESHIKHLTQNRGVVKDTIHEQIAEGDWVATRFTRTGYSYQGKKGPLDMMHLKRFEGGKIAEIWEYFDRKQFDEWEPA